MHAAGAKPDTALRGEAGFALVEMLVAMLLLSLVGLTLARFQTFQLAGAANIAAVAAARLEADNQAVELMAAPHAPTSVTTGTSSNGGRNWFYTITPGPSPDPNLLTDMVDLKVEITAGPGQPVLARRQLLRPMIWPTEMPQQGAPR